MTENTVSGEEFKTENTFSGEEFKTENTISGEEFDNCPLLMDFLSMVKGKRGGRRTVTPHS